MGVINLLPEKLINQIAAGEVVERPASVVKELIENSIDAGATEIIIDIEDGGRRLIRVTDNGSGMTREDAILSLQRHATSKIREKEDLFNITTLGFRGEALPSIASVSNLKLTSIPDRSALGTSIHVEGGKQLEACDCGGPVGTSVEVRDLFFNTPARLKFMKSNTTEVSHITAAVTRMAVSHPYIRFKYNQNGSTLYNLPAAKDLLARICSVISEEDTSFIEVSFKSNIRITGYISGPEINRPTQRETLIFVNGRFVKDRVILHALMEAYRTVMEKERYPLAFLFLEVPPAEVDVNVHPVKTEVRFRNTDEVHRAVYGAVTEALKRWTIKKSGVGTYGDTPFQHYEDRVNEAIGRYASTNKLVPFSMKNPPSTPFAKVGILKSPPFKKGDVGGFSYEKKGFFSSLNVLGRAGGTYIVCTSGNDLLLIDQHAAHERISFERLKTCLNNSTPSSQVLLIPETLELNTSEVGLLREYIDNLAKAGLLIDHFGGNTFVIKAVPTVLAGRDVRGLIKDIVDELAHLERSSTLEKVMDKLLSRMACHSAVEGGDSMDRLEIAALLHDLDTVDFASNCPHGRPVFVMLRQTEIEKMFGRR